MKFPVLLADRKEMAYGWRYLAFQTVFLGYFLSLCIYFFKLPWTSAELNLLFFCLNFVVAVVLFRRFLKRSAQLALKRVPAILITAVLGFLAYYFLTTMVSMLIFAFEPEFFNINNQNISAISQKYYWPTAICTVLLVPVAEELFHRAAIFGGLYRRNRLVAYLVSVSVFALVHVTGYVGHFDGKTLLLCYLQYLPAGLCLAASYDFTGCIYTPILIHAAINAVGILAMR